MLQLHVQIDRLHCYYCANSWLTDVTKGGLCNEFILWNFWWQFVTDSSRRGTFQAVWNLVSHWSFWLDFGWVQFEKEAGKRQMLYTRRFRPLFSYPNMNAKQLIFIQNCSWNAITSISHRVAHKVYFLHLSWTSISSEKTDGSHQSFVMSHLNKGQGTGKS